jgi:hypothetical protein
VGVIAVPLSSTARPSSTVTTQLQVSGQSIGQAPRISRLEGTVGSSLASASASDLVIASSVGDDLRVLGV